MTQYENKTDPGKNALTLDEQQVLYYLLQNRDFLSRYEQQLFACMPEEYQAKKVVSLWQWHHQQQQQQLLSIQQQMETMIAQAAQNETLLQRLLTLANQLMAANQVEIIADHLQQWARQQHLLGGYLRLLESQWPLCKRLSTLFGLSGSTFHLLCNQRLAQQQHYLGHLNETELASLLPQLSLVQRRQIGSVALSLLGEQGEAGVVIFISERPEHYQAGMATTFLTQISHWVSLALKRCILASKVVDESGCH